MTELLERPVEQARTDRKKPLWLLDVDGVLNAVRIDMDGYHRTKVSGFTITYRAKVIDFINDVHRRGLVEVRWLTTWCEKAPQLLAPSIGIDHEFAVEGTDDHRTSSGTKWWKAVTAERLVAADPRRPIVWTDDDLSYANRSGEVKFLIDHPACLGISPRTDTGLTDGQLSSIYDFLRLHS